MDDRELVDLLRRDNGDGRTSSMNGHPHHLGEPDHLGERDLLPNLTIANPSMRIISHVNNVKSPEKLTAKVTKHELNKYRHIIFPVTFYLTPPLINVHEDRSVKKAGCPSPTYP